jgi:hypothetical protein
MNSHELAKIMLKEEPREISVSIDICTCQEDCGLRGMGTVIEVNCFTKKEIRLVAEGSLNYLPSENHLCVTTGHKEQRR